MPQNRLTALFAATCAPLCGPCFRLCRLDGRKKLSLSLITGVDGHLLGTALVMLFTFDETTAMSEPL